MQVVKRQNNKVNAEQGTKLKKTTIQRPFRLRTDVSYDCIPHCSFCEQLHSVADSLSVLLLGKTSVERSKTRKKSDDRREEYYASTEG